MSDDHHDEDMVDAMEVEAVADDDEAADHADDAQVVEVTAEATTTDRDEQQPEQAVAAAAAAAADSDDESGKALVAHEVLEENVDDDDADDDDDDEEVVAAVVVDDDDEDDDGAADADAVEAAAQVVDTVVVPEKKPTKKKVKSKKKSPKRKKGKQTHRRHDGLYDMVPPENLEAAGDARAMLQETVPSLPIALAETQVRSFGRLCIEENMEASKFSTTSALYPIGFSCDRYEFSPVHGRILKLRCSILDGRKIKEKQKAGGHAVSDDVIHDGPVFRVMWGIGVDEDEDNIDYPFDPYVHAAPITSDKVDAVAIADPSESKPPQLLPEEGMRVKVRFDKNRYFCGSIVEVGEPPSKKKKRKRVQITIRYDDGVTEKIVFPDPDVSLLLPGVEDEINPRGEIELTKLNGKPVSSVVGTSPLEVWGRALIKLGLIDEIMFEASLDAVKSSREKALKEAKGKLEAEQSDKVPDKIGGGARGSAAPSPVPSSVNGDGEREEKKDSEGSLSEDTAESEPPTEKELELRVSVEALQAELDAAQQEDRDALAALAEARIGLQGPFLCNPFQPDNGTGKSQQGSWLATAVRKEKMRMGSTGNKKKVVTALDLLERNDTLYNTDIEALIEGLPGSEYCGSYVFQAFRSGGSTTLNRSWVHEAKIRREKEALKRLKRSREVQEKENQEREKVRKRKQREEVRDARKRQKLEEEDQKKRARAEERLSRLQVQVDERLFNEASFQREKVISAIARNLAKEFGRRRKAAEVVAGQAVVEAKDDVPRTNPEIETLPALSKVYDEDTVRVWDFMSTFGPFFLERGYVSEVPTLDSLQTAVEALRGQAGNNSMSPSDAVSSLTELAVALCKPLAASLTRVLFSSLIALNPTLQKDFGAAFFNEMNATTSSKDDSENSSHPDVLLPVNAMTWQEIARVSFLSDALGELGLQRHEAAHILRGYRSAGHPNSKEARRLRKAEDFWIALLRQEISLGCKQDRIETGVKVRVDVPCAQLCSSSDFRYFLHNIKSLQDVSLSVIRKNIEQGLKVLQSSDSSQDQSYRQDLGRVLQVVEDAESKADSKAARKAMNAVLKVFDKVSGIASDRFAEEAASGQHIEKWAWQVAKRDSGVLGISIDSVLRQRMGLLNALLLTRTDLKMMGHQREKYMEEALVLKEEEKRKELKEDEEDEEEDDDDEEDEDNGLSRAVVVTNEEAQHESTAHPKSDHLSVNGNSSMNAHEKKPEPMKENGGKSGGAAVKELRKIGKPTEHDSFCGDIPMAPELIRRCLAVLRTLCLSGQAVTFLNPVDPQSNPGYYDPVLRPMCLREVGKRLQEAAEAVQQLDGNKEAMVENAVADFGRNVRLIEQNTLSYANAGPTVISAASELLRIFERLFFDWVLAPEHLLPPLEDLDDDKCVEPHVSDEESTVLLCDGCEGKYNISRLNPPLQKIPKDDWYCPRCVSGRWWGDVDPRIGKVVRKVTELASGQREVVGGSDARIRECFFRYSEEAGSKPSLMYSVEFDGGLEEIWSLEEVNLALDFANINVPKVRCLEAVAESPGYGPGVDHGLRKEVVPLPLNPNISDSAAQVAISSSVFRDTITASGTLLVIEPKDMTASEWLRLLVLLTMKCASSDLIQNVVSTMENKAAEQMSKDLEQVGKVTGFSEILPDIPDSCDDNGSGPDATNESEAATAPVALAVENGFSNDTAVAAKTAPTEMGGEQTSVVVEASAVEVVEDMDIEAAPSVVDSSGNAIVKATEVAVDNEPTFADALSAKRKRRKAIEDSIAGYCIKSQLRPTVASFEEDNVSQVVDSSLSSKWTGLDFASLRCRRMVCSFCGLTDTALGTPLLRVPNEKEWHDLVPHAARGRRTHLVAELPFDLEEVASLRQQSSAQKRLIAVTLRVDGEIVSMPDSGLKEITDGGMLEFLPRSVIGFQHELQFRNQTGLPFVTGSLSAHECCAIAAHNSRKELMMERHKARQAVLIEEEAARTCGRTLEIGRDSAGRSYWKFNGDPGALFVCISESSSSTWHRFGDAASISSVVMSLGKESMVKDLLRAYPEASRMLMDGSWADQLLKRRYFQSKPPIVSDEDVNLRVSGTGTDNDLPLVVGGFEPYEVGEDVLVESKTGQLLWDASVTGISRRPIGANNSLMIDAYRVHYKGWSTRFTEWVDPCRVVEPNENNRLLQEEILQERAASRCGLPTTLNQLIAKDYLYARDRARGNAALPDFARIASEHDAKSSDETTFATMKAAILAIEAALPVGCVDNTDSGPWRSEFANQWRVFVQDARGPARLMQCVILLEDMISEEWIREDIGHLRSCLPARWKAIGEASPSSLAIRIILFDRSIIYGNVNRKRFSRRKSNKKN